MNSDKPRLVPFEPQHLDNFIPGCFDKRAMSGGDVATFAQRYDGKAISIILDDRILAISGVVERNGTATVWALISDEMRNNYPVLLWRSAVRGLKWLFEDGKTVEALVHRDFDVARKWVVRLGFKETEMSDEYVRYVKCR